jgi:DNA polymerase-3 subunit delta'
VLPGSDFLTEFPWLEDSWSALRAYIAVARVPHALLVHGPAGIGKMELARVFAARRLCTAESGEFACGDCGACRLLAAGTHPDFVIIESPEPGKAVKTDLVREVIASLSLCPQYAHNRIVVLPRADRLNRFAANSLLKTLEEPDPQTCFVLLAEQPGAVPPTIRSRCQRVAVSLPPRAVTEAWLQDQVPPEETAARVIVARGAPLIARTLDPSRLVARRDILTSFEALVTGTADPIQVAGRWEKFGSEELVSCLISWLEDLIRLRSAPCPHTVNNPDLAPSLSGLAATLSPRSLYGVLDLAFGAKRALSGQANRTLMLEELAIACCRTACGDR